MQKPNDYDNVQAYGEFTPLKLGGHICKIMQVKETKSAKGKNMLEISLDIAEGDQKDYFAQQYKTDTRENKKWGCTVYQLINDANGNTGRGFKSFITAAENSNPGFKVTWGDKFASCFKGKLIGGVFGREQYLNNQQEKKFATKCMQFRSVEVIRNGVDTPEDKLLPESQDNGYGPGYTPSAVGDGFMNIPNGLEEELPFM
ncbi:hypothetical protein Ana3638_11775 [Anaerocolumna sedimenticola]|uniref:Uncharacterized protein n=1 Tax=Anaerocolumna sedimenticola TaxID=2696063 RepID=A0A6P1TPP3_9FIRM|nr:hypothetical protein [Anaerocolumna sedimenticola]QHQ61368.1 hypothetical protein Ana3638_11775 [Anaerocolumna sedimenticola]